jgi:UDP-N-acetylglucosamine 1-carboxyvinyltransferase
MGAITNVLTLNKLEIKGPRKLKGTHVIATDLRGGASLFLAGLIASGTTEIEQCDVILRGYSNIVEKLKAVGADIEYVE